MVGARGRWARVAVCGVFFTHGAVAASWAARVPVVREQLHLSAGVLGLVLAGPGLGALAGSQVGGLLVRRFGGRAVSAAAPLLLCLPLGLVPLAGSAGALGGLLALLGAADGATSVAMNAQAVTVQEAYGRSLLGGMHAVRSLGAVAGGLAGSATAALSLPLARQFAVTAVVLAAVAGASAFGLLPEPDRTRARGTRRPEGRRVRNPGGPAARRVLLALAVTVFLASVVEDAPASWSGVYLRHVGAGEATAAAGYAAFCAGEVTARLALDRLADRFGWARLVRWGSVGCAFVLAAALLAGRPVVMLAALVVAGAGVSAVFPGAFAAAGALPDRGVALGQVGFAGNAGWLAVSPLIGGLTTLLGLSLALTLLPLSALAVAALAGYTHHGTTAPDHMDVDSARMVM